MKKEFNLLRKYFVAFFFLGFMLVGTNMNAQAQARPDQEKLEYMRAHYVTMQGDYQQGTAKYNYVGDVISYIDNGLTAVESNQFLPADFYTAKIWNKVHPDVLASRTAEEIAQMQVDYESAVANGADSYTLYKLELYLNANN